MWHISSEGAQGVVEFLFREVVHVNAGMYHCVYWKREVWAGFSESLELPLTGIYKDKASLTAHPGPQVAPGGNVTLLCQAPHFYDNFILFRDRGASLPQVCSHQADARSSSPPRAWPKVAPTCAMHLGECTPASGPCPATPLTFPSQGISRRRISIPGNTEVPVHPDGGVQILTLKDQGTVTGSMSALDQVLWAHSGSPSQPGIWAVPGAMIPLGGSVSIFCRVLPGVTSLRLHQSEPREAWYDRSLLGPQEALAFSLQKVTQDMAGIYFCHYWKRSTWSARTESLELVVTGLFKDKPSLTAVPGPQVASGGNVTLLCRSLHPYDTYILCRGGASSPQGCSRQDHSSFLISPVSPDQAGTYTCYGCPDYSLHQWSKPSEPLVLSVTSPDHRVENVIRLSLAVLILLVLGAVLLEAWKDRSGL